jgi:hypothetical protein
LRLTARFPSALTHSDGAGRRSSLSQISLAVFVQTKGFALLLCAHVHEGGQRFHECGHC